MPPEKDTGVVYKVLVHFGSDEECFFKNWICVRSLSELDVCP